MAGKRNVLMDTNEGSTNTIDGMPIGQQIPAPGNFSELAVNGDPVTPGGGSLTLTDADDNSVTGVTSINVVGATVGGSTPDATLTIPGGGSGNTITLTADTNLAAGTAVSLNSAGHAVQTWGPTANATGAAKPFTTTPFPNGIPVLKLDANNFVVFATVSGVGTLGAKVGTNSDGTITFGAANTAPAFLNICQRAVNASGLNATLTSNAAALNASLFVTSYGAGGGVGNATVAAVSIAAQTMTVGTPVEVAAQPYLVTAFDNCSIQSVIALDAAHFAMAYGLADGSLWGVIGSVFGTTITLGTARQLAAAGAGTPQVLKSTSSEVIFLYNDGTQMSGVAGSIIGTTLTLGTPVAHATFTGVFQADMLGTSAFIVSGAGATVDGVGTSNLVSGTLSGQTIAFGSDVVVAGYNAATVGWPRGLSSTRFVVNGIQAGVAPLTGSVSGTAITMDAAINLTSQLTGFGGGSAPLQPVATFDYAVLSSTSFMFNDSYSSVYQVQSGAMSGEFTHKLFGYWLYDIDATHALAQLWNLDSTITLRVLSAGADISSGSIGCIAAAVTSGDSATVTLSGACSGFSGLTPGTQCFANGDGTITMVNTGHPIGVAQDSSTLIIL